jgi:predicted enzyme related to lactoylglutathione lyase
VEKVTGIGGVFNRSLDPQSLRAWYGANLGLSLEEWGGSVFTAAAGDSTVWSIFPEDTDYWPNRQQTMINYRVDDLDAMLAQLRAAGVAVDDKTSEDENGRFGWATDPEGNRFELWQPATS